VSALLLVEDDRTISELLTKGLRAHDHQVVWSGSGRGALREASTQPFDLVLLDLGLPDLDGIEVCRRLRAAQPGCVLVILTARGEEMDVVIGLEAGADDYLTKPFRYTELLVRIRAHLRRGGPAASAPARYVAGELVVDTAGRRCYLGGHEIPLRAKEFDLLARFATEPDAAITREALISDVWDEHWYGPTKTLDVHVATLRRKIATAAEERRDARDPAPSITTLRGYGYRLDTRPAGGE
jgi:DNA-binding response OmpR family regulator